MRPLRYSINITLDGCCDHTAGSTDEELHHFHAQNLADTDGLLCGRVIYQMMEEAWREPASRTPAGLPLLEKTVELLVARFHSVRHSRAQRRIP
jgi:hypothetical protein